MKTEKRRLSCTRALTAAIIMAIIISLTVPAFAAERYEDVSTGTWFYDAVMFCTKYGMVNGTSATTFSPQGTMTRSQFITVLGRMDGIKDGSDQPVSQYTDVDSAIYYYSHVNWCGYS